MKFGFNTFKTFIPFIMLTTTLYGCLSVAKISSFPKASAEINFDRYSTEYQEKKDPFWTSKTSNEYYFERNKIVSEKELTDIIQNALREKGYSIYSVSLDNDNVFGKRGMYANEWNSISGVYYKIDLNKQRLQIYINTKITQDITGGWSENRAKKVGLIIETMIDSKK
jgi:hypothetical protein